jgi:putative ABC transport system substrate-binding protein
VEVTMKRRHALYALLPLALPVAAQRPQRIGYLSRRSGPNEFEQSFLRGLREAGLVEGTHFVIDYRWAAEDSQRMASMAAELVALRPDVVVGSDGGSVDLVRKLNPALAIVAPIMGDPVRAGQTTSLSRPDRNITGSTALSTELSGKRLELLIEAVPKIQRIGALFNAAAPHPSALAATHAAGTGAGVSVIDMPIPFPDGIPEAFAAAVRQGVQGFVVISSTATISHREPLCLAARTHRLPAIFPNRTYLRGGAMMSYGPDLEHAFHRAAYFVQRILKGARPADLPIEQPAKLELVLNPPVARTVGVVFPQSLLVRGDEIVS